MARAVVAGIPYHVSHYAANDGDVFFKEEDYETYLTILKEEAEANGLEIWGYCLLQNRINLIVCGKKANSMARSIGLAHSRYSRHVNLRENWKGSVWASRFASTALDPDHLMEAIRYVEQGPVEAGLVEKAAQYQYSSAKANASGKKDKILSSARPFPGKVAKWEKFLKEAPNSEMLERILLNTRTGRPSGSAKFIAKLEAKLGRTLTPQKRGRKPGAA